MSATIDNLPVDVRSTVEKFLQLTKDRITKFATEFLNIQFHLFCRKITIPDCLIFLKSYIFGGTTNYTNRSSHTLFAKLLSDPDFVEMMACIKQATKEKSTLDNLREEIKPLIEAETFKNIILEELTAALLAINSGNGVEKTLAEFTQSQIQNLISEANRWHIKTEEIISTIKKASMDPILFYDKDVSIFSIIEIYSPGQTIN